MLTTMRHTYAGVWSFLLLVLGVLLLAPSPLAASIIITNSTNINLANSQVEVGGDTSDNPNVVNGSVGPLLAYSASASAGDLGGLYGLSNLNDGDIGVGILSDGTYAIPFNGTLTLAFGGTKTISSIAIYNGYGNRDDGTYLLQDAANNTLGGYTISGTGGATNNGVDSFWLTFTTPVTTTALKLTFAVPPSNENTPSFREIQVFGPAQAEVPEPVSLAIWGGIGIVGLVTGWRRKRL